MDAQDRVIVTDSGNARLDVFDANGTFLFSFGAPIVATDIAVDSTGRMIVVDEFAKRIRIFDAAGNPLTSFGSTGSGPGEFNSLLWVAVDSMDNIYTLDGYPTPRVQVFDSEGTFKTQFTSVGAPTALCITRGPQQVLYVAHTGDPDGMEDAAIYKIDLQGNVLGKFGSAGKLPKEFGLVNSIDCRNENELLVGELANWRVQKLTLRAAK